MTAESDQVRRPGPSAGLFSIPNLLSLGRAVAGPIVLGLVTAQGTTALVAALVLMVVAELSDVFDGMIARRYDQETQVGQFIDPICDSVYHLSVFLAFLANGWMPAWMLFVIYARDLAVPYIRTFVRQMGGDLPLRLSGKIKTAVHAVVQLGVVAMALGLVGGWLAVDVRGAAVVLLVCATIASIYSLVDYGLEAARLVRR